MSGHINQAAQEDNRYQPAEPSMIEVPRPLPPWTDPLHSRDGSLSSTSLVPSMTSKFTENDLSEIEPSRPGTAQDTSMAAWRNLVIAVIGNSILTGMHSRSLCFETENVRRIDQYSNTIFNL